MPDSFVVQAFLDEVYPALDEPTFQMDSEEVQEYWQAIAKRAEIRLKEVADQLKAMGA